MSKAAFAAAALAWTLGLPVAALLPHPVGQAFAQESAEPIAATGVVGSVDFYSRTVTVSHPAIEAAGLEARTSTFPTASGLDLGPIGNGQEVAFTLEAVDGGWRIATIAPR